MANLFTWCLGRPTIDGNTALGASSPAKPALHMPEPLSTTNAATSSSHILSVYWFYERRKKIVNLIGCLIDMICNNLNESYSFYNFFVFELFVSASAFLLHDAYVSFQRHGLAWRTFVLSCHSLGRIWSKRRIGKHVENDELLKREFDVQIWTKMCMQQWILSWILGWHF